MKRFFEKIDKDGPSGCWIWLASLRGKTGYGAFKYLGKVVDAHRVSFIIHNGQIPSGMLVCHTCDNRKCVNPEHLFLGSHKDNMQDCKAKGRLNNNRVYHKKHPSRSAYRRGCRCGECRRIVRDAQRLQRLRSREVGRVASHEKK